LQLLHACPELCLEYNKAARNIKLHDKLLRVVTFSVTSPFLTRMWKSAGYSSAAASAVAKGGKLDAMLRLWDSTSMNRVHDI
jgi:hypothetical protein